MDGKHHHIVAERSGLFRAHEAILFAGRIVTTQTIVTFHARHQRRAYNAVAHLDAGHVIRHLDHLAGKLMAQDDRIVKRAFIEYSGNVRAANAAGTDTNLDHSRFHLRNFYIFIANIFIAIQQSCFHRFRHFMTQPFYATVQ